MPNDNSLNTGKGHTFQALSAKILSAHFGTQFNLDHAIGIGKPPKPHRFDLVSTDFQFVGECKNYSWTETGNMPSAKMGFINEALLYLSYLPKDTTRFIVTRVDRHARRQETLTEYYFRTYRHLLENVRLFEIDIDTGAVREHA